MSRRFVLLGDPVAHSLSPTIQDAAFRALGVEAVYEAVRVEAVELERAMRLARSGGNVTVPHKARAATVVDVRTEAVRETGACNCFWTDDEERLCGENSDVEGFRSAVDEFPEARIAGGRVLVLGAGGAAAAVVLACVQGGARRLAIANRTPARAEALARRFAAGATEIGARSAADAMRDDWDLVVNATSLGLSPADPLPMELDAGRVGAVLDLVYGPGGTPWTRHARFRGVPSRDGLGMLIHQAALSVRRWVGLSPPLDVMRRAAAETLAGGESTAPRDR